MPDAKDYPQSEMRSWDILMIDIVRYSELFEEKQRDAINRLTHIVRESEVIKATGESERIFLPTGDGMAIGFRGHPERPLKLASEIHSRYGEDRSQLKIGIYSGIAFDITDINGNANIAGSGINMAQRTVSCCRGGHILVARNPAEQLRNTACWGALLHGPYEFLVKHVRHLVAFNFCDDARGIGNPEEDFHNLVSIPSYVPLKARLARLGITADDPLRDTALASLLGDPVVIDDIILETPILGFQGVAPEQVQVTMTRERPHLPGYVLEKRSSLPEPPSNRPKVYLARLTPPLSDEGDQLGLDIGYSDFWTAIAVEECVNEIHADIEFGNIRLLEFPRQLVCHMVVITSDSKIILCKRSNKVRYEKLAWSVSFEESIDAEQDCDDSGLVNPSRTVQRALEEELGLPDDLVRSARIKFVAIGTEWKYLSAALIIVVRLPATDAAQAHDFFWGARDREHSNFDAIDFTISSCLALLTKSRHDKPGAEGRLHCTSRLRILSALFSEFGYGEILSSDEWCVALDSR